MIIFRKSAKAGKPLLAPNYYRSTTSWYSSYICNIRNQSINSLSQSTPRFTRSLPTLVHTSTLTSHHRQQRKMLRATARLLSPNVATLRIAQGITNNKVNSLGFQTRQNLLNEIKAASKDPAIKAIIITGSDHSTAFSAGADITEFNATGEFKSPSLHDLIETLESVEKPTVAAIKGVALGGGLELALACKYRVADGNARVGLPEVHLGIIPGAGGTQRLPRLSSVNFALDAITSGRMIKAPEALKNKVIDGITPAGETLESYASSFALESASNSPEALQARNLSLAKVSGDVSAHDEACEAVKSKLPQPHMGGEAVHGGEDTMIQVSILQRWNRF